MRKPKEQLSELEKLAKKIGDDWREVLAELEAADSEGLNKRVTQASQAIHDTIAELNDSPEYTQAKADVKLLSSGLREVKKRQNTIVKVCLELRKSRGEA